MGVENDDGFRLAGSNATPPTSSSYWVIDGLFLGGAYPGSQEPDEHEQKVRALLDAGVRMFVSLMEPDETDLRGRPFVSYDEPVLQLSNNGPGIPATTVDGILDFAVRVWLSAAESVGTAATE